MRLRRFASISTAAYGAQFRDPLIRAFFDAGESSKMAAITLAFTLGWRGAGHAGYPLGGSQAVIRLIAENLQRLGGRLRLSARVESILVENDAAVGVRLENGEVLRAERVISAAGVIAGYDRLLLATGSDPVRLKVRGHDLPGVFCFRNIDDVDGMLQQASEARHAVVIGGGLLGLEAASALAKHGLAVTVVHIRSRVMDRQLDDEAADYLRSSMESRGIRFRLAARTEAFEGDIVPSDEVTAWRWVRGDEIGGMHATPDLGAVVAGAFRIFNRS